MGMGMGRGGVARSINMLLLLPRSRRGMRDDQGRKMMMMMSSSSSSSNSGGKGSKGKACSWVPHPRTGIYFPGGAGHDEWVMEDVPLRAATFSHSCWFRNVDGVDNHNHPADS